MDLSLLPALLTFAFVSSATPGPNNLMLMASGANFGFRRTIPHMLGVAGGFVIMAALVGLVLMGLFDTYPWIKLVLEVICVGYLLYLAWKIAHAAAPGAAQDKAAAPGAAQQVAGQPFSFLQAALFQWVNPKAWGMATTAITAYATQGQSSVLMVALAFAAVNLPTVSAWAAMGTQLRRVLTNQTRLRVFNWTMALLLIASLYPIYGDWWHRVIGN